MHTTNTAGRGLAIAAGVVLASGTLAILFEDVLMHGAAFTLKHWLTLVTVAGTMMVGHLADLARRQRHWASVAGFTALFLAGTGLVVYSSVGRQAEKTFESSVEHDQLVAQRVDLKKQIEAERKSVQDKRDAADAECATGIGPQCKAKRATVAFYETSLKGLEARLQVLDAPKPVSAEAEQLATVAAALGYNKEQVRAIAILLAPFFTTLFLEFGTIVSFGFAFSPKRQPKKLSATNLASVADTELAELRKQFELPSNPDTDPEPTPPGNRSNRKGNRQSAKLLAFPATGRSPSNRRANTVSELAGLAWLRNYTHRHGFLPSQDVMATELDVHKGTVAKWMDKWEAESLIVREQAGRCKTVRMA